MIEEAVDIVMSSLADLLGWLAENPAVVVDIVVWAMILGVLAIFVVVVPGLAARRKNRNERQS